MNYFNDYDDIVKSYDMRIKCCEKMKSNYIKN